LEAGKRYWGTEIVPIADRYYGLRDFMIADPEGFGIRFASALHERKVAFRPIPVPRSISSPNLIRWSGLAAVVGSVRLIISNFLELLLVGYDLGEAATTRPYVLVTGLTLLGTMLLLVGLIGLYVGQLEPLACSGW
jgi:hypothetical protein